MDELEWSEESAFIHFLAGNIKCADCGQGYDAEDIHALGHQDRLWIMGISCANCGTQGIVFAMLPEEETSAMEVLWELTDEEWERFRSMPEIEMDDVLDVRRLLRDFQGDLKELIEGKGAPG
jgi:hypothetical protein